MDLSFAHNVALEGDFILLVRHLMTGCCTIKHGSSANQILVGAMIKKDLTVGSRNGGGNVGW